MDLNQAPAHVKALGELIVAGMAPNFQRLEQLLARMCENAEKGGSTPGGGNCPDGNCPVPTKDGTCKTTVEMMNQIIRERCDLIYDPCDAERVAEAIQDGAWPLYKKQIGRSEMAFQRTLAIGTGKAQTVPETNTTFVAGPTIAASRSLLVVQDLRYPLPWRPGCLKLTILPAEGVSKEDAYANLVVTAWVALRSDVGALNTTDAAQPIGYYGEKWNEYQIITGDELYCDGCVKKVALRGPCIDDDWIGKDAVLLLQIDNLDGTNSVTFRSAEVDFKHVKKVCCDDCASGKVCNCGGH